jgi:hypothetical protein
LSGHSGGPSLDLRTQPKLDATFPEVDHRRRHVLVLTLVLKHRVAVGEAEDVRDALRVE